MCCFYFVVTTQGICKVDRCTCHIFTQLYNFNLDRKPELGQMYMHVMALHICDRYQSKKESKDQELIQSSNTPVPGYQWESNKLKIRHHK